MVNVAAKHIKQKFDDMEKDSDEERKEDFVDVDEEEMNKQNLTN